MKRVMMIGLVVFGGTQGIYGMAWINKYVKPTRPTRQQLSMITPAFLSRVFSIQEQRETTQSWESNLRAQVKMREARNSLNGLADNKYNQLFSAVQRAPRRSWISNQDVVRPVLQDTPTQIHPEVFAMYGA
jgi:hypothetical protein